jgi:hypothetical protein
MASLSCRPVICTDCAFCYGVPGLTLNRSRHLLREPLKFDIRVGDQLRWVQLRNDDRERNVVEKLLEPVAL